MNINDYQHNATTTAIYPGQGSPEGMSYTILGLLGEAGELANKWKKYFRDDHFDPEDLSKELGDVLWYLAQIATELNIPLEEVANANLLKLRQRAITGTLKGSGDER